MVQWTALFPENPALPPCAAAVAPVARVRPPTQIRVDPENARNGLMQLVLTLVELIRELLERQALRRIDSGTLTAAEVERLGLTFLRLSQEMARLKTDFGFRDEDLNIDLGPLGRLR
ncbi:MAG: gas vesicle protein K [Thermoguttaceae bacterium]|jgi:transposase